MSRSSKSRSLAPLVALLVCVACGGRAFAQAGPGKSNPKGGDPKHQNPKACELLTSKEVTSTLKVEVGDGQGQSNRGDYSCNYPFSDGSGRSVMVTLKTGPNARAAFLQKRSDGDTVFGVGDEAVWIRNYSTLLVRTRDNEVLEVDLTTAASGMKRPAPKDAASDLARKALGRL